MGRQKRKPPTIGYDYSIFENHYLFEKKGSTIGRWCESKVLGVVLDRPNLKIHVKNVFNRFRSR